MLIATIVNYFGYNFDFSTLAALYIFSELYLDAVVLEIGLGGRLDPVNLVDPDVSVLTNVELDHQELLGNSREEIGKEKSAIFKKNSLFQGFFVKYQSI